LLNAPLNKRRVLTGQATEVFGAHRVMSVGCKKSRPLVAATLQGICGVDVQKQT
jgi:hypothetical protein